MRSFGVQRNGRPNVATRRLQASHQNILWIAKDDRQYRFNYRLCKRSDYDDWLSKRNQQLRDVWDIPANSHENKACRHPSPKPLAVLSRILDVAGKPGGLLLDLFSGSGTGSVAASEWGMRFPVSIEREAAYDADDPPTASLPSHNKANCSPRQEGRRYRPGRIRGGKPPRP